MSAEERHYDVLIIGGGPAGAILASLLGQHNYRTLLVERDIHPRGHGYMSEYELESDVRDSIASRLYSGTSDIQKNIIAARLGL